VPHVWMQEKIFTDCVKCQHFRRCGQYAMVAPLDAAPADAPELQARLRQGSVGQAARHA
jgi:hypothetical protein